MLTQREEQLWQRQEAMWQQQLAHWQHERDTWAQREATLLAHIQELHSQLATAFTPRTQTLGSPLAGIESSQPVQATEPNLQQPSDANTTPQVASTALRVQMSPSQEAATSRMEADQPLDSAPQLAAAVKQVNVAVPDAQPLQGPPPPLCLGSDDIYWVHQLQSGLMDQGYYCGEEEMEDFVFSEGTQSAVLAFQVLVLFCSYQQPFQAKQFFKICTSVCHVFSAYSIAAM